MGSLKISGTKQPRILIVRNFLHRLLLFNAVQPFGEVLYSSLLLYFSGFAVTESFKSLAKLSTPVKSSKPSKTNSLGRQQSETKTAPDIMDSKDKTVNNNKLAGIKQKSSNGLINKLKKARIVT